MKIMLAIGAALLVVTVLCTGVVRAGPVLEPGGGFAHHPVLLDGAGHQLVPVVGLRGAPPKVLPSFRDFRVYRSKSFKDLLSKGLS